MKLRFLVVVLAFCFLVSCGTDAINALPTPQPTALWTSIPPGVTPTFTPVLSPNTLTPPPTPVPPTVTPSISPEAFVYLEKALDIMQEHSINRHYIDWNALRAQVYGQAEGARALSDTYTAIRFALRQLGDHHSLLMTPTEVAQLQDGTLNNANPDPKGELLENRLGYVFLPGFAGGGEAAKDYATAVQQIIREIDVHNPCGWIVDLRQDTGGNMWPMLAGIGPILGEGRVGAFIEPDGQQTSWYYNDGQAKLDELVVTRVNGPAYQLVRASPPVAVLTGRATASSGEAIAVAFRRRPNTRSFGEGTGGLPTANRGFTLSDGAWILLTVSTFADRTGQTYESSITPDQLVYGGQSDSDPVIQAAIEWLWGQPACTVDRE